MSEQTSPDAAEVPPSQKATVDAPAVESPGRGWLIARPVLLGGLLGIMISLGLLALSRQMLIEGGMSFAGWAGRVVHDGILQKPGVKTINAVYGEDEALSLRGDIRTLYILFCAGALGALIGLIAGGVVAAIRLRRPVRPATEPVMPWSFPLGLAVLGLFFHGFVWGNVAVMLLPRSRRRALVTAATWIVAFIAVAGWAWALEIDWPEGWSKIYPWSRKVFFFLGHAVGAKE
jgi:hypothetical protein